MKIIDLGDNLFEIQVPWYIWNSKKSLTLGLLSIQRSHKKIITSMHRCNAFNTVYLVTTMGKGGSAVR